MRRSALREELRRQAATEKDGIRRHAARLALGEIDSAAFFRVTEQDWLNLGKSLFHAYRGKLPEALDPTDLAQEMRLEAARVLPKWDPEQRSIGDYLVFNACSKAKKWLNRQRNAEGRKGNAPSRLPIPASRLSRRRGDDDRPVPSPFDRASVSADQDGRAAGMAAYRLLKEGPLGQDGRAKELLASVERLATGKATKRDARRFAEAVGSMAAAFKHLEQD
jgi:hypothetical protein